MMVVANLRALLMVLCLLFPAASAFADDAWVLWDQSIYAVKGQEPAVLWTQWGSPTTKAACEQRRHEEVQTYERAAQLFLSRWSKQGDAFVLKDNGEVVQRISYYCYPITTNPRWEQITASGDWYLMGPPRSDYDKTAAYLRAYRVFSDRRLSEWNLLDAFESRQVCELMRDTLHRSEQSMYAKAASEYLKMTGAKPEPPTLSLQRLFVETHYANIRTYAASRCVHRDDRELPLGLNNK